MSRIRLNQEYRNKVNSRMRVHLEAEDTQERKSYDDQKADQLEINDNAWTLAKQIVRVSEPKSFRLRKAGLSNSLLHAYHFLLKA